MNNDARTILGIVVVGLFILILFAIFAGGGMMGGMGRMMGGAVGLLFMLLFWGLLVALIVAVVFLIMGRG